MLWKEFLLFCYYCCCCCFEMTQTTVALILIESQHHPHLQFLMGHRHPAPALYFHAAFPFAFLSLVSLCSIRISPYAVPYGDTSDDTCNHYFNVAL